MTTRTHAVLKIQVSFLEIETKVHLLGYKQLNTNVSSANILHYLSGCSSIPCIVNSLKSITSPIPREGSWQFLGCNIFSTMILRNKDNQAEQNINRKRLSDREIDSVRRKEKRVGSNGLQWASKLPGKAGETCHTLCWAGGYIRNIWEQITKVWTTKDACQRDMGKGLTMRYKNNKMCREGKGKRIDHNNDQSHEVFGKTEAGVAYHKFKLQLLEERKGSVWGWVTTETGPIANWDKATWVNETMLENANLDFWNSDNTTCVHRETLKSIVIPAEWDIKIMLLGCGLETTIMLFVR